MGKSDPASSEMAAETAALLHLLLYAALACAMSMLGREHRAPAWRGGRMEMHHPTAGNQSDKGAASPGAPVPVRCP